ncbi:N-acetyl-beta-D-galactosaminidase [Aureococcus anophagefferens]|nr:N-acetyl-beta-D-galactosaminidase [Aureococcus anophagefferens]
MRVAAWLLLLLNARATTIWPAPAHMHAGSGIVAVSSDAEWRLSHPRCETLRAAVERYRALIARGPRPVARGVRRIDVVVANASEAYPADWSAAVIFGAFGSDGYFLPSPFKVRDAPRFAHRGLLVDAARHFLPPRLLERTVDAMSYTKLNVLHLHLSDHESFPLRLPGFPSLKPWSWREAYTADDMARLVEYGRLRGVAVMAEADSPGHAAPSWCRGNASHLCVASAYDFEPCVELGDASCGRVLGVEAAAAVWGEKVDAAELERTAWPRAAAVAERAWSPRAARYSARTEARLLEFRCVLLGRGVALAASARRAGRRRPGPSRVNS